MLKLTILASLLTLSSVSMAAVELKAQIDSDTCTIKNGKVTKTTTLSKGEVSFTVEKAVKFDGLEALARRVSETSRNTGSEYFSHELTLDGKTYLLNADDSKDSMILVSIISRLCKSF